MLSRTHWQRLEIFYESLEKGQEEVLLAPSRQRPSRLLSVLHARGSPTTKNDPARNVSDAEVEKSGADGNSFQEHMGGVWMVLDQGGTSDLMSKGMRSEA